MSDSLIEAGGKCILMRNIFKKKDCRIICLRFAEHHKIINMHKSTKNFLLK